MDDGSGYREPWELVAQLRAETHLTKAAIAEAEEYLDIPHGIMHFRRQHRIGNDVEIAERYVDLLYQVEGLSAYLPD